MNIIDIITKKKHGLELTKDEINYFITGYMNEEIADYQVSSLLMAICLNKMTDQEIFDLTEAMLLSGDQIDLSTIKGITIDKHSTGGVGDKTSLILAPLFATFGLSCAKMSGRGLGHTGGTLDKLEAIEGFNIDLTDEEFFDAVKKCHVAIIGQTKNLVPADKKLYALRDVTATVDSIGLIASSIMSKKLASGSQVIILDVKYGSGAFMKTLEDAIVLANQLVKIGNQFGRNTFAFVTDMTQPLGHAVGNSLEVQEAIDVLNGVGPKDITELCTKMAELVLVNILDKTQEEAALLVQEKIASKVAYNKFVDFIKQQGGNTDFDVSMPKAQKVTTFSLKASGYISEIDAEKIGKAAMVLGAGRAVKTDVLDYGVGIVLSKKVGDLVAENESVCEIHYNDESKLQGCINYLNDAYLLSDVKPVTNEIIKEIIH